MANRFAGVRATVYYAPSHEIIRVSREHNDANMLSIGARFVTTQDVQDILEMWLKTDFSGKEKYKRRIEKMDM